MRLFFFSGAHLSQTLAHVMQTFASWPQRLADFQRRHPQRILAAVAALLLVSPWTGWPAREMLLGLSVVLGTAKAFQMPAQQAVVPTLIPITLLPRAMAFSSAGLQSAIIAGPALGGLLYAAGAQGVYATCALLFALASAIALTVNHPKPAQRPRLNLHEVMAGVRYVREQPVILGAISLDLFAVLLGGATALLPMFAKDILHVGPWGLGVLRATPAVGALAMSDRKSTRLNSSHIPLSRMPSSA